LNASVPETICSASALKHNSQLIQPQFIQVSTSTDIDKPESSVSSGEKNRSAAAAKQRLPLWRDLRSRFYPENRRKRMCISPSPSLFNALKDEGLRRSRPGERLFFQAGTI